jgi:hypothetical protein
MVAIFDRDRHQLQQLIATLNSKKQSKLLFNPKQNKKLKQKQKQKQSKTKAKANLKMEAKVEMHIEK